MSKHLKQTTVAYKRLFTNPLSPIFARTIFSVVNCHHSEAYYWIMTINALLSKDGDHKLGETCPNNLCTQKLGMSPHRLIHVPSKLITWRSGEFINTNNGNCLFNRESMPGNSWGFDVWFSPDFLNGILIYKLWFISGWVLGVVALGLLCDSFWCMG